MFVGNVFTDVVSVGDVSIPNQAVELAEKLSPSFLQEGGSDGLLGLAWPALNTVQPSIQATPVQNMIKQNLIPLVRFPLELCAARQHLFILAVASFHGQLRQRR